MPVLNVEEKQECDYAVFVSRKEAQRIERELLVCPDNLTVNSAFRKICYLLLDVVQRAVPKASTNFVDYTTVAYCVKLLRGMGLKPIVSQELDATATGIRRDLILNSFEYRNLRNKMLAGLSIIADLPDRPASAGSPEYQQGMREGYRRASAIAVMFLNDIDGGN